MKKKDARDILINACCADAASSLADDAGFRNDVARHGFRGFADMADCDIVKAASDANLDESTYGDEIRKAIRALTKK